MTARSSWEVLDFSQRITGDVGARFLLVQVSDEAGGSPPARIVESNVARVPESALLAMMSIGSLVPPS